MDDSPSAYRLGECRTHRQPRQRYRRTGRPYRTLGGPERQGLSGFRQGSTQGEPGRAGPWSYARVSSMSARRVGIFLALWSFGFACVHVAWALGWRAGVPESSPPISERPIFLTYDLVSGGLMFAAAWVSVLLIRENLSPARQGHAVASNAGRLSAGVAPGRACPRLGRPDRGTAGARTVSQMSGSWSPARAGLLLGAADAVSVRCHIRLGSGGPWLPEDLSQRRTHGDPSRHEASGHRTHRPAMADPRDHARLPAVRRVGVADSRRSRRLSAAGPAVRRG